MASERRCILQSVLLLEGTFSNVRPARVISNFQSLSWALVLFAGGMGHFLSLTGRSPSFGEAALTLAPRLSSSRGLAAYRETYLKLRSRFLHSTLYFSTLVEHF